MFPVVYNLLFPFVFLLLLPGFLRRMVRRGQYQRNFGQRLGLYSPEVRGRLGRVQGAVWLQAVSVGEMLVALKLLSAMRARDPGLPLVVSTTTTTGYALAAERVPPNVEVLYTPIDTLGAVRRAFAAIAPSQLVIVDGGLWPNQLWEARRRGVPTALVNARLSPRSERRFRRFLPLAEALFKALDLVGVPESTDVERWAKLGVPANCVHHTGSIKFDDPGAVTGSLDSAKAGGSNLPRAFLRQLGILDTDPVLLAASTHPGEEEVLGKAFQSLKSRFPTLFLIVVPRHVERSPEVKAELEGIGCRVALRQPGGKTLLFTPDTLLLNTTGELRAWYAVATVAFIGKSLRAIGGQNPAEAVAAGVPVVFGTHMENFEELRTRLLSAGAAIQINNPTELEARCAELLAEPSLRARLAAAAHAQISVHRGASARTAARLEAQRQNFACKAG